MSLLLDALKRAEQEKQARQGEDAPRAAEPAARATGPANARKLELEAVQPASAPTPAAAREREREAARGVFAAKQPDILAADSGGERTRLVPALAAIAVVIVAAGAGYVWYEVNRPMSRPARAPAPAPAAAIPPAVSSTGSMAPPSATQAPSALPPTQPAGLPPEAGPPPVPQAAAKAPPAKTVAKPAARPSAGDAVVASALREAASGQPSPPPVRISPPAEAPRVPADVRQGYEALRRGDNATARARYEAAVAADPSSIDGHLGLATAAAGSGERETAARHYRRVLELDAGNAAALAGLAALQDFTRAAGVEAKLRADIAQNPRSPALHYTLASLYASQARWTEAQAAYFEAYRLDPENAEIAYNLAVSLDNLGQRRLAGDYYGRALAASRDRGARFDRAEVARRMAELKP